MTVLADTLQTWQGTIDMVCLHVIDDDEFSTICVLKRKIVLW